MCSKTEFNPPWRVTKIVFYRYLSFLVILIVVCSPILACTLIHIAHVVDAHSSLDDWKTIIWK